jgi:hypothetical protein
MWDIFADISQTTFNKKRKYFRTEMQNSTKFLVQFIKNYKCFEFPQKKIPPFR